MNEESSTTAQGLEKTTRYFPSCYYTAVGEIKGGLEAKESSLDGVSIPNFAAMTFSRDF